MLTIKNIHKSFGSTQALRGVSFDMQRSEIVALLGPSGCGKSTLLGIIAGLLPADQGEVRWNGSPLAGIPVHQRGFGLMFQDYALFPHMNVARNIAFGLQRTDQSANQIEQRVEETLVLVGLPGFEKRDVNTLSGGEQQRVALARSLAPHPRLLMLDEPLGSLDRSLRERLMFDLTHILRKMRQTAIYVTHDQEEAFAIADRVLVMRAGEIEQMGTPQEIYCSPASPFVARFLGMSNIIPGEISLDGQQPVLTTTLGRFPTSHPARGRVEVLIRSDAAQLDGSDSVKLRGVVLEQSFRGSSQRIRIQVGDNVLNFDLPTSTNLPTIGTELRFSLDPERGILVFPAMKNM